MRMNTLANGALEVSALCLGSMTWGSTNTPEEGHDQIDMFLDHGGNFIDTAEMYPVNPILAERCGASEATIGGWLAKTGRRDDVVIATKVSGDNPGWKRNGKGYDGTNLFQAVEESLAKLNTDYIDVYQTHWPLRGSYAFRQNWTFDPSGQNRDEVEAHMRDVLEAMADLVKGGKVRHFALSNESAWGTAQWLRIAREMGAPEVVSVQNEYSLMHRLADTDLAELCMNEGVRILSYSPLATGLLTGKYQNGAVPAGSRLEIAAKNGYPDLGGRITDQAFPAVGAYQAVADKHGLDLVQMSLAFVVSRPFMGSTIFGASSIQQLARILDGKDLVLSDEVLADIDAAHRAHPMPF
ncbi:Predicted oxidoreductase [Aliiroseovarius halocynthiae]|uniref:Aldo/keto reductase n=1 Tax=Aliiroseovarius halocynthiae TaxID=985055 RepID=A0A545SV96_9RHOB|nr:aldo/keto reductase [Aliiroseovarius halocynthiae]TQV68895.1 aldo/keto reductase [Aliiroseovarius halocynthiae]SMR71443.1 Predicted oxidoreductase [Aliiroseovarius halocynthiae]